jgi:hypothetical protein
LYINLKGEKSYVIIPFMVVELREVKNGEPTDRVITTIPTGYQLGSDRWGYRQEGQGFGIGAGWYSTPLGVRITVQESNADPVEHGQPAKKDKIKVEKGERSSDWKGEFTGAEQINTFGERTRFRLDGQEVQIFSREANNRDYRRAARNARRMRRRNR